MLGDIDPLTGKTVRQLLESHDWHALGWGAIGTVVPVERTDTADGWGRIVGYVDTYAVVILYPAKAKTGLHGIEYHEKRLVGDLPRRPPEDDIQTIVDDLRSQIEQSIGSRAAQIQVERLEDELRRRDSGSGDG